MANYNEPHNKKIVSEDKKAEIIKAYLSDIPLGKICEIFDVKRTWLQTHLKGWEIRRDRSEAQKSVTRTGARDRTCADINFLKSWTPESAWLWGLWFGDGWVSKRKNKAGHETGTLSLCGQESVMQMAKNISGCTSKIFRKKKKDGALTNTYTLHLGGNKFVQLVEDKFQIPPGKKSHTMTWPVFIPEELLPHYLRGLWDSDGSWWTQGSRDIDYLYSAYCSCSIKFLESLRYILHEKVGVKLANIEDTWNEKWQKIGHVIRYASRDSTKIGNFMYNTGIDIEGMRHPDRFKIFDLNKVKGDNLENEPDSQE